MYQQCNCEMQALLTLLSRAACVSSLCLQSVQFLLANYAEGQLLLWSSLELPKPLESADLSHELQTEEASSWSPQAIRRWCSRAVLCPPALWAALQRIAEYCAPGSACGQLHDSVLSFVLAHSSPSRKLMCQAFYQGVKICWIGSCTRSSQNLVHNIRFLLRFMAHLTSNPTGYVAQTLNYCWSIYIHRY